MPKSVFYSFHFDNDVFRVQTIRNIGSLQDNSPVSANDWESVRRGGDAATRRWIDQAMNYRKCVVVLIGSETAYRPWVRYEIEKAWADGRGLLGINIHNLTCMKTRSTCQKGPNPFDYVRTNGGALSSKVRVYDPFFIDAYKEIASNIEGWVDRAINERGLRW